ncbi:MAG: hypothetical protein PF447_14100 [Spirochaetaceae bacterium]|nr:hypothetical protein [Spirochaetaceae bacterium]
MVEQRIEIYADGNVTYPFEVHGRKEFLIELLKEVYLWNDEVEYPESLVGYDSVNQLLWDLRVPEDRFSFAMKKDVYNRLFQNGQEMSFGFRVAFNGLNELRITEVLLGAEGGDLGLHRGDRVLAIDGRDPWQWYQEDYEGLVRYFQNYTCSFQFELSDGTILERNLVETI